MYDISVTVEFSKIILVYASTWFVIKLNLVINTMINTFYCGRYVWSNIIKLIFQSTVCCSEPKYRVVLNITVFKKIV